MPNLRLDAAISIRHRAEHGRQRVARVNGIWSIPSFWGKLSAPARANIVAISRVHPRPAGLGSGSAMAADINRPVLSALREAADAVVCVRLGVSIGFAVAAAMLAAVTPVLLKFVIDGVAGEPDASLFWTAAYLASLVTTRVAVALQLYYFGTGEQSLQRRVDALTFRRLLGARPPYSLAEPTGASLQAHAHALQGIRQVVTLGCMTLLPVLIQLMTILAIALHVFPVLLWLILAIALAAYAAIFAASVGRLSQPTRIALTSRVQASQILTDALINLEAIKAFCAEAQILSRHDQALGCGERAWRKSLARRVETGLLSAVIFALACGGSLWLGIGEVTAGSLSVGDLILLNAYLLQVVAPVEAGGYAIRDLTQAVAHLRDWRRVLCLPQDASDIDAAKPARPPVPRSIVFRKVCFGYEPGRRVLRDVSFDAPAGGAVAIVGASGAGKSSLLRLLQRHYLPDEGEILLDGEPVQHLEIGALRRSLSIVSQDVVLLNDTLRYNLRLADAGASDDVLYDALKRAGLSSLLARLPAGLDAQVGERGVQLSGGERQRVAIARALLRPSDVLVLDEPTSALDPLTEMEICEDLFAAARGRTTLIVTHRLALARRADIIIVLHEGCIQDSGRHQDLLLRNGVYAELWRQQTASSS